MLLLKDQLFLVNWIVCRLLRLPTPTRFKFVDVIPLFYDDIGFEPVLDLKKLSVQIFCALVCYLELNAGQMQGHVFGYLYTKWNSGSVNLNKI